MVSTVYGYIGTPPAQRQLSSLVWRLGPSIFLEEVLPATSAAAIYELGPNYVGSFQAVYLPCESTSKTVLVEHGLLFLLFCPLQIWQVKTPEQSRLRPHLWLWFQRRRCPSVCLLTPSLRSLWPKSGKPTTNWTVRPLPSRLVMRFLPKSTFFFLLRRNSK